MAGMGYRLSRNVKCLFNFECFVYPHTLDQLLYAVKDSAGENTFKYTQFDNMVCNP